MLFSWAIGIYGNSRDVVYFLFGCKTTHSYKSRFQINDVTLTTLQEYNPCYGPQTAHFVYSVGRRHQLN